MGAKFITNLLASKNIEFVKEVSLKSFSYDRDLRLDFLICQNKIPLFVIEVSTHKKLALMEPLYVQSGKIILSLSVHKLRHSFATRYHAEINDVPKLRR